MAARSIKKKKKKKSSLCDAIEVGLSFLLKCESKLMHFFPAIAKLASFQVTGSNVNPDRAADVKNRLANKKRIVSPRALHISTFSGTFNIREEEN